MAAPIQNGSTPLSNPALTAGRSPAASADFNMLMKTTLRHAQAHHADDQATEHAAENAAAGAEEWVGGEPPAPPPRKLPFEFRSSATTALRQGQEAMRQHAHADLADQIQTMQSLAPELQGPAHEAICAQLSGMANGPDKQALLKQLSSQIGALPARGRAGAMSALLNAMDDLSPDEQVDPVLGFFEGDGGFSGGAGGDGSSSDDGLGGGFDNLALVLPELSPEQQLQFLYAVTDAAMASGGDQRPTMVVFACRQAVRISNIGDKQALLRQLGGSLATLPAAAQGKAWSSLIDATETLPVTDRADMVDELAGGIEYARHSDKPAADITNLGKMIAAMPAQRRMRPLNSVLSAAPMFDPDAKLAIHAMASSASDGMTQNDHLQLVKQQELLKVNMFLAPTAPLFEEGGVAENLPNPWHDSHAFADAVEASDRVASGDALPDLGSAASQTKGGNVGRAIVTFNEPGLPRFRDLMQLLAAEHQSMLQRRADYRQVVGEALQTGPVRISMSPQYPWPSACDQDSLGQHLISLNPNLLGSGMARIAAALAEQMRQAAGSRSAGRQCSLSAMRYADAETDEELDLQIQADRIDPWSIR